MHKDEFLLYLASSAAVISLSMFLMMTGSVSSLFSQSETRATSQSVNSFSARTLNFSEQQDEESGNIEVTLSLPEVGSADPTVFTAELVYDPEVLSLKDVVVGDIWNESNVLEESIDNKAGSVIFSAGRGFGAVVEGSDLAVFTFRRVGGGEAKVSLTDSSGMVMNGSELITELQADTLTIK